MFHHLNVIDLQMRLLCLAHRFSHSSALLFMSVVCGF